MERNIMTVNQASEYFESEIEKETSKLIGENNALKRKYQVDQMFWEDILSRNMVLA